MVRVSQAPVSNVEGSLVLLPMSGKGVLAHVDCRGLLHGVDQEVADCRVGVGGGCVGGGEVTLCTVAEKRLHVRDYLLLFFFMQLRWGHTYIMYNVLLPVV
jgi:hypothetical protein